ncbi:MAG: tetratricopeptide repeat protein, partial [Sphingobacteriaceae bacterium]
MLRSVFLFILLSAKVFAQEKNTAVFVVGKVISAEDSSRVKAYFYEALKEKTKDNIAGASRYFNQILEIDPSNDAVLYEIASLYHSQNQEKEAEKYAREAVTVNSDNKWYWLLLGDIYKKTRNLNQLILVFNELIRINPAEEDYYFDKANAFFIQGKNDEAEKVYAEIEDRFGSSEGLVTARQRVYQKQGNTAKATSDLEELIAKDPTDVRNYLNLSEVYLKAGDTNKTIQILNKAKAVSPNNPYISLALADVYKSKGKTTEAFTELKKAFADPGLNIDAKVQIILSFFPEFEKDATIRTNTADLAAIATQTHPADPKAFSVYGDVLFQDNQLENSKNAYKKALELNNQVYQIWEQLLYIQTSQRNYPGVIADGEEALT